MILTGMGEWKGGGGVYGDSGWTTLYRRRELEMKTKLEEGKSPSQHQSLRPDE